MNRKISIFITFTSVCFILFLITNNKLVLERVNFSISVWKDNLFPTLFPFFVLSNILLEYNFIDFISRLFKRPMGKLFNLPGSSSFVFIVSLFSGFPSGAKYTKELLKEKIIGLKEANSLITFTFYSNPLFIIGFIGNIIFNNIHIGLIILISHIISGIIIGIIFKPICKSKEVNRINKESNKTFGEVLKNSINDGLNTMFLLLGIITMFTLFTSFFNTYIKLPGNFNTYLSGIFEMTQGIKNISYMDNTYLKLILTIFYISFGGISVHMQVLSIISSVKIKYKYFFIARVLHGILSIVLVSIIYFISLYYL